MIASCSVAALALRAGLRLRRNRVARAGRREELLRAHLRLAKRAVLMIGVGFLAGPLSALWLRDWTPFGSLHAWLGSLAAMLFATTAILGRRLERGRGRPVEAHAILAGLAVMAAAITAVAGFILLP
jgi:hypothetical protein